MVWFGVSALFAGALACAGRPTGVVSPREVPALEARVAQEPDDAALLSRFAAALFAASQFDSAQAVATRALALNPGDATATLVAGQYQERAGQYDQAIRVYQQFASRYPRAQGASAVRGRELLARKDQAAANARSAMRREQELAQQPGDPQTVAVLPITIVGDSSYQPLSRGLAQMMISDLSLLQRFRMVERLQVGAIMDELKFSQSDRVDPATAARVGRLVQAGRLVQGVANIPATGPARLEASVVQRTGEVGDAGRVDGTVRGLLQMEKDLVVQIAGGLGYVLSEAERRRILQNGTQNLQAFLAYSRGLLAEDAGDYSRAALYFSDAIQADPGFQAARDQQQAAVAAPAMQVAAAAGQVTGAAPLEPAVASQQNDALNTGTLDLAATSAEQTAPVAPPTQQAVGTATADPPPSTSSQGTTANVTGTVKIIFRLP